VASFPTTRQSLVGGLTSDRADDRDAAREALARQYWIPLYSYVRARYRWSADDAADLVQQIFVIDLERTVFARFDTERARFRTFLRACADNAVRDDHRRKTALKRGARAAAPTELAEVERWLSDADAPDPVELMDRAWRGRVLAEARARTAARLTARGKPAHVELLHRYFGDGDTPPYAETAAALGVTLTDVNNWLHAVRTELRLQLIGVLHEGGALEDEVREETERSTRDRTAP